MIIGVRHQNLFTSLWVIVVCRDGKVEPWPHAWPAKVYSETILDPSFLRPQIDQGFLGLQICGMHRNGSCGMGWNGSCGIIRTGFFWDWLKWIMWDYKDLHFSFFISCFTWKNERESEKKTIPCDFDQERWIPVTMVRAPTVFRSSHCQKFCSRGVSRKEPMAKVMATSTDRSLYLRWWRFDLWRFFLSFPSSLIYLHATKSCTDLMFFFYFSLDLLLIASSLILKEWLNFTFNWKSRPYCLVLETG